MTLKIHLLCLVQNLHSGISFHHSFKKYLNALSQFPLRKQYPLLNLKKMPSADLDERYKQILHKSDYYICGGRIPKDILYLFDLSVYSIYMKNVSLPPTGSNI